MALSLRSRLSALVQRRLQVERRSGKQITPVQRTLCVLRKEGQDEWTTSVVKNLLLKGIAVAAERSFELGEILHALLVNASHTFSVAVDLKVVRCFRMAENQFFIAGPFTRSLAHEEVVPFII
jgi:hypothetical protein